MLLSHKSRIRREVLICCKYGIRYDGSGCGGGGGSGGGGSSKRCVRYGIPHADLVYHVRTMETMRATRLSCAVVNLCGTWDRRDPAINVRLVGVVAAVCVTTPTSADPTTRNAVTAATATTTLAPIAVNAVFGRN